MGVTTYMTARDSLLREVSGQLQTATGLWSNCLERRRDRRGPGRRPRPACKGRAGPRHGSQVGAAVPSPFGALLRPWPGNLRGLRRRWPGQCHRRRPWRHPVVGRRRGSALRDLPVTRLPPQGQQDGSPASRLHPHARLPRESYILTATVDQDGNATCITGLPLGDIDDTLHDLAVAGTAVFGWCCCWVAVLGTAWVGLSLRPLRRVAAIASQVAELPLESGEVEFPAGVPDTDPRTETGQLGAAFNRMLGHVQTALARRNASETRLRRFAADASHELRTPLAAIRGYAELALRRPGDSPEPVTHALRRVLSESTRMTVLVDDLLLLARLDAGRPLDREPVDISRVAIDATSDARVARPGHRWILDLPDDPVTVPGDEHRLQQVLVNLLSNAGRHTPEGTTVTVRLSVDQKASVDQQDSGGEKPGADQPAATAQAPGRPPRPRSPPCGAAWCRRSRAWC